MKRKVLSMLLITVMGMSLLVGCGGNDSANAGVVTEETVQDSTSEEEDKSDDSEYVVESEEDSSEEAWETFFEVNSINGTNVKVYYDPNVIASADTFWEPEFSVTDTEGNVYDFAIVDCDTAEKYLQWRMDEFNSIQSKKNGNFSELEEYGVVGGNTVKKYNLEYEQISTDDNNNAVYTPISYSECIIELGSVVVCFDYPEEQKCWDTLASMKFGGDSVNNDTSGNGDTNQDEDKEADAINSKETDVNMQTCEFPACVKGQTGILTYNGDSVEVTNSDKLNGADFDVKVNVGKTTYTVGVTLGVHTDMSAEGESQSDKEWLETKAKTYQLSEIKETTINEIPVKYYSCVYSTNGENESYFFNCYVEFPTIQEYYNYTIMFRIDGVEKEDAFYLSVLENLLLDVELLGVKPLGVGEVVIENDEFDENKYYPEYLSTSGGKTVEVYFDIEDDLIWEVDNDNTSWLYVHDANSDTYGFSVHDAASAEEYINSFLQQNDHMEIEKQEEISLSGRTIHAFHFKEKETGREYGSMGVIELASDVVFTFYYEHVHFGEQGFEDVLGAIKFRVE